jgi:PKD repeat protein
VSLMRKTLIVAVAATVTGVVVQATSIVPPENFGELARMSHAVVLAQAGGATVVRRGAILYTRTEFSVIAAISGPLTAPSRFIVEVLGGQTADEKWVFPGSPEFLTGAVYLLPLTEKAAGVWLPTMASYGVLRQVRGRDGSTLLEPLPESGTVESFPRPDGILPEPVATYVESALVPHLRAVLEGKAQWDAQRVLARSTQLPFRVTALSAPAGCSFLGNARWQYGNTNPMSASNQADSSIGDGGYGEVQGALGVWAGMGSSLSPAYGGKASLPPCPSSFPDMVAFNDPCNDIGDLSGCSGTLAQGGYAASGQHTFDGSTWWSISHWSVVVNNGAGCIESYRPGGYTTMMAHEMGHGLGFGHTADPSSLMYPSCCQGPDSLDVDCATYLYPIAGPTATPTPTRTPTPTPTQPTSPPAAPTGVTASDGAWADRVRIIWNPAAGATSYHVYRNTTNDSGTAADLGSVTSTGADDFSAGAGTTYWYWVKAFNSLGGSGFSSPDTGYRSTTPVNTPTPTPILPTATPTPTLPPAPPPAPGGLVATDGTFSDRVRITWNASAGATSYHVYRNTANDSGSAVALTTVTTTSCDDTSASTAQVYWYWVRAFNAVGGSPYSVSDSGYRAGAGPTPTPTPIVTPTPTPPIGLTAAFTFLPTAPTAGKVVQFTDTSVGALAWQWTFGDGQSSTTRNPLHTYSRRGTYTVTLRITGLSGSAQTSQSITVGARARQNFSR